MKNFGIMKNIIRTALILCVIVFCNQSIHAQTPQFITGTTNTGSNSFPLSSTTNLVQWLYLPGDFIGATSGVITNLYFMPGTTAATTTFTNLTIKMGTTSLTTLTSGGAWISGLTTVYFATSVTITGITSGVWFQVPLQTPFPYDNSKNLVIEVSQTAYTTGITVQQFATTTNTRAWGTVGSSTSTGAGTQHLIAGIDVASPYWNDAGISAVTRPSGSITAGIDTVKGTIKNYGKKNLISAGLRWSVDGVLQPSPADWSGSIVQYASNTNVIFGTYTFPVGVHTIKAWTVNPNGVSKDSIPQNDTSSTTIMSCSALLNGNYTIGPKPSDFQTISDALLAIGSCGISGPVKFTIKKGTYNERCVVNPIINASAKNTITFDGVNTDSVKVTWAGTSSGYATVFFNGADYVTFKNMTVENTGTTYGYSFCLTNSANYNTFDNLKLYVDQSGTSSTVNNFAACSAEGSISGYADCANYTMLSNCILKGGYYGIKFNGTSTAAKCTKNTVSNCILDKQYYYGINFYYQDYPSILNNSVTGMRSTTNYGIYNYYGGNGGRIIGNTVVSMYYGLYNYYCTASRLERNTVTAGYMAFYIYQESNTTDSSTIINNMIRLGGNPSYAYGYGIYLYYGTKVVVYHNTVQADSTYSSPTSYGAIRVAYCYSGIKIKNNIFRCFGNLPPFSTDFAGIANGDLDYNIYFTKIPGNLIAYWGAASYTSLAAWKLGVPTMNKNSSSFEPQLMGKYNQHLSTSAPFYRGISLGISIDRDNDLRCVPVPTIGADEFTHPYEKPSVDFLVDSMICINSPYTFLNKAGLNEPKMHYWFLNNVQLSTEVNFTYNFTSSGVNKVKLITRSCSSIDTVTKTVNVKLATQPPVSYFILNKNLVEVYEAVNFSDLSTNCPQRWKWQIYPDSVFDPALGYKIKTYQFISGKDTSRSPQVAFLVSGKYSICLTTSNVQGTGNTYCLNNYLEVMPTATLCSLKTESKSPYGTLYDDGGFNLAYSANKSCGFYIHPCANTVSLVFSSFDIAPGDNIRIYDGSSSKGTPLWNSTLFPDGLSNNTVIPTQFDTFKSHSGKIYIDFITDAYTQNAGFSASWFSDPGNYAKPVASFLVSDTICNGIPTIFKNNSTGMQNEYYWDYENDGIADAVTTDGSKTFLNNGSYSVKLAVNSCGGVDTFIKKVYVRTSKIPPEFEILTSNKKPNALTENVTVFENTIKNCVDSTIWSIFPSSYTLVSGKLSNSYSLVMKFNDTVCYDFYVIGKYHGLSDTVFYPCFIKPLNYCIPTVLNMTTDLGISRVVIKDIDNNSLIGQNQYNDYTNDFSTDIERGTSTKITLYRNTNFNPMNRKVWIDLNRDGVFDAVSELADMETSSFALKWTGTIKVPVNMPLGISRIRIGTSLAGSVNNPCGINNFGEFEDYKINIIKDITKPKINLLGAAEMHIPQCTPTYIDPGFYVTDNVDTNLTDSVKVNGSVNTYLPGSYIITYNVKDAEGNVADQVNRVVFVDNELVAPQISLIGSPVANIEVYTSYKDPGFVANDTCSGMDSVYILNKLDTSELGTYELRYTAYDKVGNSAFISRTINVIDTIAPVIKSISNDTIVLNVYHILANPLYTAIDNYYKNVSIAVQGSYYKAFPNGEADVLGYYSLTYIATDGSGNTSTLDFVIHVVDNENPVLLLNGNEFMSICRFDTLKDPGYVVSDNYDLNPKVYKSGTYITDYLRFKNVGYYELIYTALDITGNISVDSRFIIVTDQGNCASVVENYEKSHQMVLFPNPGNGNFNIAFNFDHARIVNMTLYNSIGEAVYHATETIEAGQVKTIDRQDLKPGIYNLLITVDGKQTAIKYNLVK